MTEKWIDSWSDDVQGRLWVKNLWQKYPHRWSFFLGWLCIWLGLVWLLSLVVQNSTMAVVLPRPPYILVVGGRSLPFNQWDILLSLPIMNYHSELWLPSRLPVHCREAAGETFVSCGFLHRPAVTLPTGCRKGIPPPQNGSYNKKSPNKATCIIGKGYALLRLPLCSQYKSHFISLAHIIVSTHFWSVISLTE